MSCSFSGACGGCSFRELSFIDYQKYKVEQVQNQLQLIARRNFLFEEPIFIQDGTRRRASLAFCLKRGKVVLGFNTLRSSEIIDVDCCKLLTPRINQNLPFLRKLLSEITKADLIVKGKKNAKKNQRIEKGDVWITEADNGIDLVLEFPFDLNLELRQIIFELVCSQNEIIRVSHRKSVNHSPETIMEKIKPVLFIGGYEVYIPAGTFLQPSKAGEQTLIALVEKYLGETTGRIADLFCGVGTFSYSLAANMKNKVVAVDSSTELLSGFRDSVNRQMIPNIEIINRNLFKYPLAGKELHGFDAIIFDPPRAGAKEQVASISALDYDDKPQKIIAVSCNPHSFVRDAEELMSSGYNLISATMVDQFIYSRHSELVALFEKE